MNKLTKKAEGWGWVWFMVACFFIGYFIFSQIFFEKTSQQSTIINEFNKYVDTYNKDTQDMNSIMGKYNLKSISVDERIEIVNEYINFYNIRINHLNDFYNFIVYNEEGLKNVGVDTYQWKKNIKDTIAITNNNIEGMKNDVQQIIQYEEQLRRLQQQQTLNNQQMDEYYALLKLLSTLI